MAIRVAVDAMGGDDAPAVVIEGALRAARHAKEPLRILLHGPRARLETALGSSCDPAIEIVDAPEVIGMAEAPVAAARAKPHSSIHLGLKGHREGRSDAFLSAGNTGALVAASLFVLGRLPQVMRPSIPAYYPTTKGICLILDVGSNMDSKPEHLLQFAQMGSAYSRCLLGVEDPAVGLLSVGEEPGKGNDLVKGAHLLLRDAENFRFVGNVEGHDIMHHGADVVVCDGFVGNVVLKLGESLMTALPKLILQEFGTQNLDPDLMDAFRQVCTGLHERFNPEDYGGGSPLLGVNGAVFVLHGRSSARAVERCILMAARAVRLELTAAIARALKKS